MVQAFLTAAIEFVFVGSLVLFGSLFIAGLVDRWSGRVEKADPQPEDEELTELIEEGLAHYFPTPQDNVVPFVRPVRPVAPVWAEMTPEQLRKACQQQGIKWRNAHGKSKHLKKAEMVAALSTIAA
jgi:hypothetical protein